MSISTFFKYKKKKLRRIEDGEKIQRKNQHKKVPLNTFKPKSSTCYLITDREILHNLLAEVLGLAVGAGEPAAGGVALV